MAASKGGGSSEWFFIYRIVFGFLSKGEYEADAYMHFLLTSYAGY